MLCKIKKQKDWKMAVNEMGEGRGAVGNDQCIFAAQVIIIINQILDFVNS